MGKSTSTSGSGNASQGHGGPLSQQKMQAIADFERSVRALLNDQINDQSTERGSQPDERVKISEKNRTKACAIAANAIGICLAWVRDESVHGKIFLLQKAFGFAANARGKLPMIESILCEIDAADMSQESRSKFAALMHDVANAKTQAMAQSTMSPCVRVALLGIEMDELRRRNQRHYTVGHKL